MSRRNSVRTALVKVWLFLSFIVALIGITALGSQVTQADNKQTVALWQDFWLVGDIEVEVPAGYEAVSCHFSYHKVSELTHGNAVPKYIDTIVCKIFSETDVTFYRPWVGWKEENRT